MSLLNEKEMEESVRAVIAGQIIQAIGTDARDAILTKSVKSALTDYNFKASIEKAVCENASKVAFEMLNSVEFQTQIESAVRDALYELTAQIPHAVYNAMVQALAGKDSTSYGSSSRGELHNWLRIKDKDGK